MSLGLVTCARLPEPDPDEAPLLDALGDRGVRVELVPWDDPVARPGDHALCVLRSCWNYPAVPKTFLGWLERAERVTRVLNPPAAVRWNLHKGYLLELESAGVPIVPTAFVPRGDAPDLAALLADRGWTDVVVKPAISAASYRTARFEDGAAPAAQRFLAELARDRDALVQPYQRSAEADGERALVRIDGEWTHAVDKAPRFTGADERVSAAVEPTPAELAVARAALTRVREPLLYARVDLMPDAEGRPRVSELELVEPSLFLLQHPPALDRFADALVRELAAG